MNQLILSILLLSSACSMKNTETFERCREYYSFWTQHQLLIEKLPEELTIQKTKQPEDIKITNISDVSQSLKLYYEDHVKREKEKFTLKPKESRIIKNYNNYHLDIYVENALVDTYDFQNKSYFDCKKPVTIKQTCQFKLFSKNQCSSIIYNH